MTNASIKEMHGRLLAATPTDYSHFFGFYDICPWSHGDDEVLLLACDKNVMRTPVGEIARVCVWNPGSGAITTVAETAGWNFQHGARTQWLKDGTILFNDVDRGRQVARIVDRNGGLRRTIETSIAALHPNETYGVTPNYARLADLYRAYGYHVAKNEHIDRTKPETDGLWRVDLDTGRVSLLLSFRRLCDFVGTAFSPKIFVTHPVFAPSGRKICFFLIEERDGGSHFMWLIVYEPGKDTLNLVNSDKNSHAAWLDDERLMVWSRCSSAVNFIRRSGITSIPGVKSLARLVRKWQGSGRNVALSEGFHVFDLSDGNRRTLLSPAVLSEDGHPSKHPARQIVLCDTYPDATGYLSLFLYSLESERRVDILKAYHGVITDNIDLRCDLHPRWNRKGDQISVDYCDNGVRRLALIDATAALAQL